VVVKRDPGVLKLLVEKAAIQGYLTTDDLMEAAPDANSEAQRAMLSLLVDHGVIVLDEDIASEASPEAGSDEEELSPFESRRTAVDDQIGEDEVGMYLKEMSRVPLLSVQEELDVAICIEKGRRARRRSELLSGRGAAATRRRLEPIIQDGVLAREHLIKANTRLVVSIAKRYIGRGVAFLDLIQEGNLGLMKAVEKYDYKRGFRFSTYATWWIRQTVSRAIADQSRTIRVPIHMTDRIRQLFQARRELEQKLGRQPTLEEIANALQINVIKVQWIMKVSFLPLSLESPVGDDEDSELGHFIEDDLTTSPQQSAYQSMLKDKLEEVLTSLSPREARILRLRFGLVDGNEYTLDEVGRKFGLTRERIRQIEGRALRRLRHPRRSRQLKDYLKHEHTNSSEKRPLIAGVVFDLADSIISGVIFHRKGYRALT
jgi:RNA polymerase primary sigma factor